jgi:hypothetical protein
MLKTIMSSDALKKDSKTDLYIPYLVLFGVLFCASNKALKVSKFYELCQIELDPAISSADKELLELVPKLLELSYVMMMEVYIAHKAASDPELEKSLILSPPA